MVAAEDYFGEAERLLSIIQREELGKIRQVADLIAHSILDGGIVHLFGSGHSAIPAKEVFIRAGTLSCTQAIGLDYDWDKFERLEGVAAVILADYDLRPGEVFIVISNSGINPLPIEMALLGKERGLRTVAITSWQHSQQVESRHSSGKKLHEVVDIAIDSHVPLGDAALEVPSLPVKIGPLSTLAGVIIVNAIVVETIVRILEKGGVPPVRYSRNLPGGDEYNRKFKEKYGTRIRGL